jgi:NAD(P)-dependent dehydrogenase (short-subunit alcohol dehydrogenase family)
MRFEGKVALITAAASGIGKATAELMGRDGATVVAVDVNKERLDSLTAAITAAGGTAHGYVASVLQQGPVDALVADVVRQFKRIDILVNAVGGSTVVPRPAAATDELSLSDWQAIIDFNLTGTFLMSHAVIPVMKAQRSGKIVNLASMSGYGRQEGTSSAYAAAKAGIMAFTTKMAHEFGPSGINVNAIAPSWTLTERIRPVWEQRPPEAREKDLEATPLRRMAVADDQARVICFLASADADFVTGVTIDTTGGA